jgi:diguanylate cyclase (GGDEF)-like protein/PAS domain S-box-containing protein
MNNKTIPSPDSNELRRQAEARLGKLKRKTAPLPAMDADIQRLVHELEVHQIELEMQNEELMRVRAELEAALCQFTDLYDFAPVGYFTLAGDGTILQVNLTGTNLLGVERRELLKRRFGLFISAESRATFSAFLERVYKSQGKETCDVALLKDSHEVSWARIEATCLEDGQEYRMIVFDITARKQAETQLSLSQTTYQGIINSVTEAIYIQDENGVFLDVNRASEHMYGYSKSDFIGRTPEFLSAPGKNDLATIAEYVRKAYAGIAQEFEFWGLRKDGSTFPKAVSLTPGLYFGKKVVIAVARDISANKRVEEELRRLSTHDALTGLYNRGFLMEEMARLERGRVFPVSIVMADIDHLKEVNDHHGHAAGDELLKRVAQVLTAAFRSEDVVARLGGDEFAVLLPGADASAANDSLQRVRQAVQENNAAHPEMPIDLSLGLSTAEKTDSLADVLKEADEFMYLEKRGRNGS